MFHVEQRPMSRRFNVLVVGGGHAGCEAAAAASRLGARVAMLTLSRETVGAMSCNPAIGGVGKGHLVREIDALDGLMGRAADAAAIHYRMLNRSKGSAVRGPRVQADRKIYAHAVRNMLTAAGVETIEGEAAALILHGRKVSGVTLTDSSTIHAESVVLATGTFLNGRMFRGAERDAGGRVGEPSAIRLADQLRALKLPMGRLKTGTPPRLDGRNIAWGTLQKQPSDRDGWTMSPLSDGRGLPQLACAITRTTPRTHEIIRDAMHESPLETGAIRSRGPRYCPSIEDKVERFADRDGHQVFLEPEGLDTSLIYPNGISTSLPIESQIAFVRSIPGLERSEIVKPGYAVEYDFIDPRALDRRLALGALDGLFLAGQINGTTGYEEAAAQGLVAGLNAAAQALGRTLPLLERQNSYIGVMLDDLTLQGVTEPYRMLTSRAEHRMHLRADNAETRLHEFGKLAGCLGFVRYAHQCNRLALGSAITREMSVGFSDADLRDVGSAAPMDGPAKRSLSAWARRLDDVDLIEQLLPCSMRGPVAREVIEDARYKPYVDRQRAELARLRKDSAVDLPAALAFRNIAGLSGEMIERLEAARPRSLAEAARIRGVTPAALTAILVARSKLAT